MIRDYLDSILPKPWLRWARDKLWRELQANYTLPSGFSIQVRSFSDWILYNDIFVRGEYDSAIDFVLKSVSDTKMLKIMDLGANVGFFTFRLADLIGRSPAPQRPYCVTMVEGTPTLYSDLCGRITSAQMNGNIRILHGLVGYENGIAEIGADPLQAKNSVFAAGDNSKWKVEYLNLNPVFAELGEIDLLKCDIEGSEEIFLQTYETQLKSVKAVVIELHHNLCNTDRCLRILRSAGLTHQQELRTLPDCTVTLLHSDSFFPRNA